MPAAAVIPAPLAYTKIVAVKKLVVGHQQVHMAQFSLNGGYPGVQRREIVPVYFTKSALSINLNGAFVTDHLL